MRIVNPIGKFGEDLAANHLIQKGYKILERNFRKGWRSFLELRVYKSFDKLWYNKTIMKKKVLNYNVIFQNEAEGGYSVWVPQLPGCASQGETFEEALENIKEAITLYLEDQKNDELDIVDIHNQFMVPVSVTL